MNPQLGDVRNVLEQSPFVSWQIWNGTAWQDMQTLNTLVANGTTGELISMVNKLRQLEKQTKERQCS